MSAKTTAPLMLLEILETASPAELPRAIVGCVDASSHYRRPSTVSTMLARKAGIPTGDMKAIAGWLRATAAANGVTVDELTRLVELVDDRC